MIAFLFVSATVWAQQNAYPLQPPPSGVATLDRERLFQETNLGKQVLSEIDSRSKELAVENREIERTLIAEEQQLTELRKTLSPNEFQQKAIDFDVKVKQIRAEQESKLTAIRRDLDEARQEFQIKIDPIVTNMMVELGIAVVLDKEGILYAVTDIDITDEVILAVDQEH